MKAKKTNEGTIELMPDVPQDYGNILNFRNAGVEIHREHGFFDVEEPEYDPSHWRPGGLYFDQDRQVFSRELIHINIEETKQRLIEQTKASTTQIEAELKDALLEQLIEINREKLPAGLLALYDSLRANTIQIENTIEELAVSSPDDLREFKIIAESDAVTIAKIQ